MKLPFEPTPSGHDGCSDPVNLSSVCCSERFADLPPGLVPPTVLLRCFLDPIVIPDRLDLSLILVSHRQLDLGHTDWLDWLDWLLLSPAVNS